MRREIADKDQLIQQYKDKLLDIVMGFDKVQEGEYSGFSKILKATEEQNRLLREVVERRDAEIDRLEANQAQNEGNQNIEPFLACLKRRNSDVSEQ